MSSHDQALERISRQLESAREKRAGKAAPVAVKRKPEDEDMPEAVRMGIAAGNINITTEASACAPARQAPRLCCCGDEGEREKGGGEGREGKRKRDDEKGAKERERENTMRKGCGGRSTCGHSSRHRR